MKVACSLWGRPAARHMAICLQQCGRLLPHACAAPALDATNGVANKSRADNADEKHIPNRKANHTRETKTGSAAHAKRLT